VARRFEISAVLFLLFNALFAFLALREQRSLLIYCQRYAKEHGTGWDCLEPYNYFGVVLIVGAWIVGALLLGVVATIFYRSAKRERRVAQEV
jgi:hypothetical protein